MTRRPFLHPSPWRAAPKVDAGRVFDLVFDVWLLLLCVGVLDGCGVQCYHDLRRVAGPPLPMYAVVERCEREVCRTPIRLPAEATITGSCTQ